MRWPLLCLLAVLPVSTAAAAGEPQLAFATSQDVVVTAASGTTSGLGLTNGRFGPARDLVWSPDGERIAYLDLQFRLWRMQADGSRGRELADGSNRAPEWSEDGSTLVFERDTPVGPPTKFGVQVRGDVMSVPADGGTQPRLLTGAPAGLPATVEDGLDPVLSADSTQVLYLRRSPQTTSSALWRMNPDGSCRQPVVGASAVQAGPVWRPGAAFGASVDCVGLRAFAIPDEYAPISGRGRTKVVVWNNGNESATGVTLAATATGGAQGPVHCHPTCALGTLAPGATTSVVLDAPTLTPGTLRFDVDVSADQGSVDPAAAHVQTAVAVLPCTIVGTDGPDRLNGTPRPDRICGKPGADWIGGGAGSDYLDAGNGNDVVYGGAGNDTILGRGGRDTIFARDGRRDWIDCGTEYDVAVVDRLDHVHHCERVVRR